MPNDKKRWTMPPELEPYREYVNNTGGNEVEEVMTRWYNEKHLATTNLPMFAIGCSVSAQINLLSRLREVGLLHDDAPCYCKHPWTQHDHMIGHCKVEGCDCAVYDLADPVDTSMVDDVESTSRESRPGEQ